MSLSRLIVMVLTCLSLVACDVPVWLGGIRGDSDGARELFRRARDRDTTAFQELERRAAVPPDQYAAFYLGLLQHTSSSPTIREEAAQNYLLALPLNGARHNLAILLLAGVRGSGTTQPAELLESAGRDGHLPAILLLATTYEHGHPLLPQNVALAKQWYRAAIALDKSPYAELRLGAMLQASGELEEAEKLLTSAAKYGYAEAQYRLGDLTPDRRVAAQWKMVASLNDPVYEKDARRALAGFQSDDATLIVHNAQMWTHAFRNSSFRNVAFKEPSQSP